MFLLLLEGEGKERDRGKGAREKTRAIGKMMILKSGVRRS
jgi:hypothetical protein